MKLSSVWAARPDRPRRPSHGGHRPPPERDRGVDALAELVIPGLGRRWRRRDQRRAVEVDRARRALAAGADAVAVPVAWFGCVDASGRVRCPRCKGSSFEPELGRVARAWFGVVAGLSGPGALEATTRLSRFERCTTCATRYPTDRT